MGIAYTSKCLDYTVYGKSEQNGTPTIENPVEIKSVGQNGTLRIDDVGKNLWDINDDIKGYFILDTGEINSNPYWAYSNNFIETIGKNYTISAKKDNTTDALQMNVCEYNENKEFIKRIVCNGDISDTYKVQTLTLDSATKYVRLQHRINTGMYDFQFEIGDTATPYQPYHRKTYFIDLKKNELCSIGDVRDKLIVENGYANIDKKIGKVEFNGSENWFFSAPGTTGLENATGASLTNSNMKVGNFLNGYCSHFVIGKEKVVNTCRLGANNSVIYFYMKNSDFNTLDEWKKFLKEQYDNGTPVTVYYELATPYVADLGQVDFPLIDGEIKGIAYNGKEIQGVAYNGKVIFSKQEPKPPMPEIVTFADGTDEQIVAMLDAHYRGDIDISDYWNVGDTRVMHLNAMSSGTGASETHVAQDMTMVIIGMEHDDLKEPINGKTKAAITLQCKELLGNNGSAENGYIWGTSTSTGSNSNYSQNPRRAWLNGTFVNALPSTIQPLIKTVIKKNLAGANSSVAGPDTEDEAFLTSYSEMFGSTDYRYYRGSEALEGNQYPYYDTDNKRIKYWNNNGKASSTAHYYWLRSPSSSTNYWITIKNSGSADYNRSDNTFGLAPAFCL